MRNAESKLLRTRSKKVYVWIGFLFLLCILLLLIAYYRLQPARHFTANTIPIFVEPTELHREFSAPLDENKLPDRLNVSTRNDKPTVKPTLVEKPFNLLILGTDSWDKGPARTDVMMVARIHPARGSIQLISIPRDTRVFVDGVGYTKINHAHIAGQQKGNQETGTRYAATAASNLLGLPIHYYIKVNFTQFEQLIDQIGGVDLTFDSDIILPPEPIILHKGTQHLSGAVALRFVRERYTLANGDFGRQEHQVMVLKAIAKEMLQPKHIQTIVASIPSLIKNVQHTNLTESDMVSLALLLKDIDDNHLQYYQIEGKSERIYDPMVQQKLWFWQPNVEKVHQVIQQWNGEGG